VSSAVAWGAVTVAVLNAPAALYGAWCWHQGDASRTFWVLLRVGQVAVVLYVIAVGVLAAAGRYASEHLFYLYALLPVAVGFIAEQFRVAAAQSILDQHGLESARAVAALPEPEQRAIVAAVLRREMGVMAIAAGVIVFLALRAAMTAHGF
jgi:hypothetical protein